LRGIFPKRIHSDAIAPFALPAGLTAEAERALGLNRVHLSFPGFQRFALGIGGDSLAEMAGRAASNVVMDSERRDDLCDDTRRPNQGEWGITRAPSLARWALSDVWAIVSADRHVDVWLLLGRSRCDRHSVLRSFRDEEHNCLGGMTIFAYKIVSRKV
jgi:hypothetical protein